jgi:hypothetical protein
VAGGTGEPHCPPEWFAAHFVEYTHFRAFDSRTLERRLRVPIKLESFPVQHSKDSHGAIVTVHSAASLPGNLGNLGNLHGNRCGAGGTGPDTGSLVLVYSGDTRPCQQLVCAPAHHGVHTTNLHPHGSSPAHARARMRVRRTCAQGLLGRSFPLPLQSLYLLKPCPSTTGASRSAGRSRCTHEPRP